VDQHGGHPQAAPWKGFKKRACFVTGLPREDRYKTPLAVGAMALQSIFLGYNWVVMKQGLQYSDPWPFTALRCGLGAAALFIVLVILRRPVRPRQVRLTILLGLLQTTGMIGLLMWALQSGAAGRVSALVYTMPFWAMILGWVLLGERIRGLGWLAAAFSLAGLVLVLDPAHLGGSLQSKLLALGSGLSWAFSAIVAKKIRSRGPVDVINLTAWQMLYGSIPIVIIAVLVHTRPIEWTGGFVAALAYNVIPATALAWALWLYVLQVLPTGVAGISTLATPVIGIGAAALVLHERVTVLEAAGMACIIAALLVLAVQGLLAMRRPRGLGVGRPEAAAAPEGFETAIVVDFPLRGEWTAASTPAERIPSHGTDQLGQRYAFDFVRIDRSRRGWKFYRTPVARSLVLGAALKDCFGWAQPICSPFDGTVVAAADGQAERDPVHIVRDLAVALKNGFTFDPRKASFDLRRLAGNHVIIRRRDTEIYAFLAHARCGSIRVTPGQEVRTGELLAEVGHSGNSTAPHLHFQLMDSLDVLTAHGLPCRFREYEALGVDGWTVTTGGVPAKREFVRYGP
jgi:drug/metabolite transporter (DMT)-like permease